MKQDSKIRRVLSAIGGVLSVVSVPTGLLVVVISSLAAYVGIIARGAKRTDSREQ
jgi:hypothetical protein